MGREAAKSDQEAKVKKAFESFDLNGDGKLSFDEFFELLLKGDSEFPEDEAHTLFKIADKDLSGYIDFGEFVDYIFGDKEFEEFLDNQLDAAEEEEAKQIVLGKSLMLRTEASKAVKDKGGDWRKLTWKKRLEVVKEQENSGAGEEQPAHATGQENSKTPVEHAKTAPNLIKEKEASGTAAGGKSGAKTTPGNPCNSIAEKTQEELVNYSIHKYDLQFAGKDEHAQATLNNFREHLKTAGGPEDVVDVQKYIAKGTAGWVFSVEHKETGEVKAMKCIRMTQALSGIKEWYCSKLLRKAGIENIVFTLETVCVLARDTAPPIIEEQLRDAGPVPYYVCLLQDFMSHGSLEDLQEKGKLTPRMMFKALEDVAQTLAQMHAEHIFHKDVKPENVLVEMSGGSLVASKLCDFGSAEIGNDVAGSADDIRRFGVTLFSLTTGEGWTKHRLIRANHEDLVKRLEDAVKSMTPKDVMSELPEALKQILSGKLKMSQVAEMMTDFKEALS